MEASLKAILESNLKNLKLPTILGNYTKAAKEALEQKSSYEQYLLRLSRNEIEERFNKRIKQLIGQARFPRIKTLDSFDFSQVNISKECIVQLSHGNFLDDAINIVFFGSQGSGKTHLASAIGRELCLKGYRVIFFTGCALVQDLVKAKNNLTLTNFFKKMSVYDLVIIDELGYIPFEKVEGDLLFQFISDRYEKKSLMITTNLAFSEWDKVFKDVMVSSAAVDRIVHYSQIFNFEKEDSFRTLEAKKRLKINGKKDNK
jgi:DNA replication protein DnaC